MRYGVPASQLSVWGIQGKGYTAANGTSYGSPRASTAEALTADEDAEIARDPLPPVAAIYPATHNCSMT